MEDAWRPVDEIAGTSVNTFVYGVERGDGLFFPSKVGQRFGAGMEAFTLSAYWRVWHNMQSLIDRGLDPLEVLRDRARSNGMDFFASVRMSSYGGMNPKLKVTEGGLGIAHPEVRDHQFAVLEELVTRYQVDGIELDFAAAPGGMPPLIRAEDARKMTPVLTDYIERIAGMARGRGSTPCHVAARVYPTEAMCLNQGLDVRTWLRRRLVDSVTPMLYIDFNLDPDMPFDWMVPDAHASGIAVFPMLQPYVRDEQTGSPERIHASPEVMRAAAANYWARGADGLYTWFLRWPHGDSERRILTELADPETVKFQSKRYVLRRRSKEADTMGYSAALPVEIAGANPARRYPIRFSIADDATASEGRLRQVVLRMLVTNLVGADQFTILLNGQSLSGDTLVRDFGSNISPYDGQWLTYHLRRVLPRQGENTLEISLDKRPTKLSRCASRWSRSNS
jgi:hypothetical protein